MKHFVWWDDPSAKSKISQRTVCGLYVDPRDVAVQQDNITCPECKRILDEYNS